MCLLFLGIPGQSIKMVGETIKENNIQVNDDWGSSSAILWQTPKHTLLQSKCNVSDDEKDTIEIIMMDDEENIDLDINYDIGRYF